MLMRHFTEIIMKRLLMRSTNSTYVKCNPSANQSVFDHCEELIKNLVKSCNFLLENTCYFTLSQSPVLVASNIFLSRT